MAKTALTKKQAEEIFDQLDVNDDGKCTIQEIKKGLKSYCQCFYGDKSDAYFIVSFLIYLLHDKYSTHLCVWLFKFWDIW